MSYRIAQNQIFEALKRLGWETSNDSLKVRWARPEGCQHKIYFRSQSLYKGYERPVNSIHVDVKELASQTDAVIDFYLKSHLFRG